MGPSRGPARRQDWRCPVFGERERYMLRRSLLLGLLACTAAALAALTATAAPGNGSGGGNDRLARINHVVVIYEENHSFDNLYGGWEGVNGLANATASGWT